MKTIGFLLLLTVFRVHGQIPGSAAPRDSMPVVRPNRDALIPMPMSLPDNAFYRSPTDPASVVRATLDNMPVHGYDTTRRQPSAIRRIRPRR